MDGGIMYHPIRCVCLLSLESDIIPEFLSHLSLLLRILHPNWFGPISAGDSQASADFARRSKLVALLTAEFAGPTSISARWPSRGWHIGLGDSPTIPGSCQAYLCDRYFVGVAGV